MFRKIGLSGLLLLSSWAWAEAPKEAQEAAPEEPTFPFQDGPFLAKPGNNIEIQIPEGYSFLGMPSAAKFMELNGSFYNEDLLGVILPKSPEAGDWAGIVRFTDEGHIHDDEKVDGDELLKAFQESEPEFNQLRKEKGFPALHVLGWKEVPHYDTNAHKLVWGLEVQSEGDQETSLNYSTRILGRTGYVSLNFVTGVKTFENDKIHAVTLLQNTRFQPGYTYADFNKSTDQVAEYGLKGLIVGGAGFGLLKAAKIGIFAKFGKVLLAGILALKKALLPLLLVLGAAFKALGSRLRNLFSKTKSVEVIPTVNSGTENS